ncbi:MAG: hypothetical protein EPN20_17925, partial [Magnetospirillum sp.]
MNARSTWLAWWPALLLIPLLASALAFDRAQVVRQHEGARAHVTLVLGQQRARIESYLNERLHFIRGIAGFARIHPDVTGADLEAMAREIIAERGGIRAIQLAPNAVVTHVVPREGNEAAIGHNLLADPTRRIDVEKAIATRAMVISGPITLRQGGEGVIARMPIFVPDGASERFWGMAIMVIDVPTLYAATGTAEVVDGVRLGLRGRDGLGVAGAVFFGSPVPDAINADILLPSGRWEISAAPEGGWPETWWGRPALVAATLALAAAFLFMAIAFFRQARRLEDAADIALFNE